MRIRITLIYILIISLLAACDDMKDVATPIDLPATPGETGQMYVLSEGLFNMNNSTLGLLNFDNRTFNSDYFLFQNNRGLGDTANDMKIYGSRLWIVVNVSSQVEVIDLKSGISIKRIPFFNSNNVARQPRYIAFYSNKAYVCSFDGTVERIDTTSLAIDAVTSVGRNPDGITVANGKLYVSNSGGLDIPNYDSTVSVVNLNTFTEMKKITVGLNPYKLDTDNEGNVYAVSRGNNGNIKAKWARINTQTDEVAQTFNDLPVVNFTIHNDTAYMYNFDYVSNMYWIKTFDCKTERIISNNFITDSTVLERPFGIYVHPTNGNVYLTDARNYTTKGDLFCFSRNGMLRYKMENVGLNPNTVIVVP
ncbi:MAG: YncE family protein [Paludibacter sp.]|nr:YncE family protein [Paludibacter sp.]